MDLLNVIKGRRSVRHFSNKSVPNEDLNKVIEAGIWAPSADNYQPVEFVILKEEGLRCAVAELCPYGGFLAEAPVAVVVLVDQAQTDWPIHDGSAAVMNMLLMAHSLGLGSCWIGEMERKRIKKMLEVPNNFEIITILPIGYMSPDSKSSSVSRKSLGECVSKGKYQE